MGIRAALGIKIETTVGIAKRDPGSLRRSQCLPAFSRQIALNRPIGADVRHFIRDAGLLLDHVHLQDVDGHADRHSPPGEGEIEWPAVFRAIADSGSSPHLVLELRDKAKMTEGFAYLESLGLAE